MIAVDDLDAQIALIRTAHGSALEAAIERALVLARYPRKARLIPLAAELSPAQRAVAEVLAKRPGLWELRFQGFPETAQLRRRWLGLDPPTIFERDVLIELAGERLEVPLWRAWTHLELQKRFDERHALLSTDLERFEVEIELAVWNDAVYRMHGQRGALYELCLGLGEPGALWAERRLRALLAERDVASAAKEVGSSAVTGPATADEDADPFEAPLDVPADPVVLCLAVAIAKGGGTIDEAWDTRLPFGQAILAEVLRVLPEQRREAVLRRGYEADFRSTAIAGALRLLPLCPSRTLANALVEELEGGTLLPEYRSRIVARWQDEWERLEDVLPAELFRPIDASARIVLPPPRIVPPPPASSGDGARGRVALADASSFARLARADRLAVAAEVAAELGGAFRASATLAGALELPAMIHVASGYELVLVPGATLRVGLTDADRETFARYFPLAGAGSWARWLDTEAGPSQPARTVRVAPFAFGRTLVRATQIAGLAPNKKKTPSGVSLDGPAASAFAQRCGFRLPSEVEWELVARDGGNATFVHDAAAVWFEGAEATRETFAGARDMGFGEWVADRWHDDYTDAPASSDPWTTGGGPHVVRGFLPGAPEDETPGPPDTGRATLERESRAGDQRIPFRDRPGPGQHVSPPGVTSPSEINARLGSPSVL